jgi:hypothetical protein
MDLGSSNLTFSVLWRVGVLAALAWAIGGALDGSGPMALCAVPLLVAAWLFAIFAIDRWVSTGVDRETGGPGPVPQ